MIKWRSGLVGGITSATKRKYYSINYNESKISSICEGKLKVPCYILVLPASFTDAERLYSAVKELYVSPTKNPLFSNDFNVNEIVIGNFYDGQTKSCKITYDSSSLCVATNAITRHSFLTLANNLIKRLNIQEAMIKDGFCKSLGLLTPSEEDPNTLATQAQSAKMDRIEDAAEAAYTGVVGWVKQQDAITYQDIDKEFHCGKDVAISLYRMLFDNLVIDWHGKVIKTPTVCSRCGKKFGEWDYNENAFIHHTFGYGSKYDLTHFEAHLCCDCLDDVMDAILPMLKYPHLEGYDESNKGPLSQEDIDFIIAYDPNKPKT